MVWTGLTGSTAYTVTITATNSGGSTASTGLLVTTATAAPTAPSLTAANVTTTGFTVNWTGFTGATSYSYSISPGRGLDANDEPIPDSYTASPNGTSGSVVWTGLNEVTDYFLSITGINSAFGTYGVPVRTLPSAPPASFYGIISANTRTSFTINWYDALRAAYYTYALSPSEGSYTAYPIQYYGTITWTGLTPSTIYTYTITAINSLGSTTWQATANTTAGAPTAPSLTYTPNSATSFTINWTGATGATSYSYRLSPAHGSYIASPNVYSGSVTWTGVSFANIYIVSITATNGEGSTTSDIVIEEDR